MLDDYPDLVYLTFDDLKSHVADRLERYGWGQRRMPTFSPGPADREGLKPAGAIVFLIVGGGPGASLEGAFEGTLVTVRAVGPSGSFDDSRRLAMAVDRAFLSFGESGQLGNVYSLGITRAGGPPVVIEYDTARRYHHSASYVVTTETGL